MIPYLQEFSTRNDGQLNAFQQGRVTDNLKLVKWVVNRIVERLPRHIDPEDLMQSGILGLIDAVKRFAWGRDREAEEFRAYAECRIRGQVMDELRQQDLLSRSARDRVNSLKKEIEALRKKLGRDPEDSELCTAMGVDIETLHRYRAEAGSGYQVSLDEFNATSDFMESFLKRVLNLVSTQTPEGMVHIKEVKQILADEIDRLTERERHVVSLYYLEEMTLKEIGLILEITESRVSQIHAQAIRKLMQRLKRTFGLEDLYTEDL